MPEIVTIIVAGKPVQVPRHTSAAEIRLKSQSIRSRPLARVHPGRNTVVSGELDVSDGDRFILGRPFTKGA